MEIHDPLIEVLERLLNQTGMYTRAHGDSIYLDMPYTGFHDLQTVETLSSNSAAGRVSCRSRFSSMP